MVRGGSGCYNDVLWWLSLMTATNNVSEKPNMDRERKNILGKKILYGEKMRDGRCRWYLNLSYV